MIWKACCRINWFFCVCGVISYCYNLVDNVVVKSCIQLCVGELLRWHKYCTFLLVEYCSPLLRLNSFCLFFAARCWSDFYCNRNRLKLKPPTFKFNKVLFSLWLLTRCVVFVHDPVNIAVCDLDLCCVGLTRRECCWYCRYTQIVCIKAFIRA